MPLPTLESIEVSRKFGKFEALAPTSFTLEAGQIAAITGANGSGKSTLLHCLTGLLRPSSGEVRIDGHDLYSDELDAKRALAFVPDVPRFYLELTAWEHLRFIAYAHEAQDGFEDRAAALLEELNISEARDLFPHNYSRGMRLKLGLAMALIRPFRVLVLDEPTSALDPEATQLLGEKLLSVAASGASVLLTSHNPDWVEMLGARRWTMRNGCLELDK